MPLLVQNPQRYAKPVWVSLTRRGSHDWEFLESPLTLIPGSSQHKSAHPDVWTWWVFGKAPDNPDQRIQEDVAKFVELGVLRRTKNHKHGYCSYARHGELTFKSWDCTMYFLSNMGVSENDGTPKPSNFIGFSITNHPFWGTPAFRNTHMYTPQVDQWVVYPLKNGLKVAW